MIPSLSLRVLYLSPAKAGFGSLLVAFPALKRWATFKRPLADEIYALPHGRATAPSATQTARWFFSSLRTTLCRKRFGRSKRLLPWKIAGVVAAKSNNLQPHPEF